MRGLAAFLESEGYKVLNAGYPSTRHSIEQLVDIVHPDIARFLARSPGKVNFVGYSMGGLLIRAYLHKYPLSRTHRAVMLGTPNHGSQVADFIKDWRLYRWLYGPAGQQLVTGNHALSSSLGSVHYELGIIAGNKTIDPVSSRIIGLPNDGKVSIESTKLDGMREHIILPVTHTFFPGNRLVWEHVSRFLKNGTFKK